MSQPLKPMPTTRKYQFLMADLPALPPPPPERMPIAALPSPAAAGLGSCELPPPPNSILEAGAAPPLLENSRGLNEEDEAVGSAAYALLLNPWIAAAVSVSIAVILAVVLVFGFGKGADNPGTAHAGPIVDNTITVTPTALSPAVQPIVPAVQGLRAISRTTVVVQSGPSLKHLGVGLLASKQEVQIVGHNTDASWYEITFPPGSSFTGWVPATSLQLPSDASSTVQAVQTTPGTYSAPPSGTAAASVSDP